MFFIRCFKKFPSFRVNEILFVLSTHLHLTGTLSAQTDYLNHLSILFSFSFLPNIPWYLWEYWKTLYQYFSESFNERNYQTFLTTQTSPYWPLFLKLTNKTCCQQGLEFTFSSLSSKGLQHYEYQLCSVHYFWDIVQFIVSLLLQQLNITLNI